MKNFAYGILAGLGGSIAAIMSVFLAVAILAPDRLPAPAISRVVHLDEKLRFIHDRKDMDPRILAVGSSIAWRQLAGEAFESLAGGSTRFLNGAAVHLQAHQTRKVARFLTAHYRNVHTLLVLTSLSDFEDCTDDREPMFDYESASHYAFRRWPAALFYLQNFAPRRYLNAALTLPDRKRPYLGDLFMDKYGSGPVMLDTDTKLGLRYGEIGVDRACVYKMAELSQDMTLRGIRTMIVFAPIHPDYRREYPQAVPAVNAIVEKLKSETDGDNTVIVKMHEDPRFAAEDFFDAFHLQWPAAVRLSAFIASAMAPATASESKTHVVPPLSAERQPASMSAGAPADLTRPAAARNPTN